MSPPPAAAATASAATSPAAETEHTDKATISGSINDNHAPSNSGDSGAAGTAPAAATVPSAPPSGVDEFGLPIRPKLHRRASVSSDEFQSADEGEEEVGHTRTKAVKENATSGLAEQRPDADGAAATSHKSTADGTTLKETQSSIGPKEKVLSTENQGQALDGNGKSQAAAMSNETAKPSNTASASAAAAATATAVPQQVDSTKPDSSDAQDGKAAEGTEAPLTPTQTRKERSGSQGSGHGSPSKPRRSRSDSHRGEIGGVSEWSHQALAPPPEESAVEEELKWQDMSTDSQMDYYDDFGHLVAKADKHWDESDDEGRGGAGRGYTRVQLDEDAQSATSMDEHTSYLFKNKGSGTNVVEEEDDDEARDAMSQMQATKDLLTEGQRIAYVGVTRLAMEGMRKDMDRMQMTKKFKKDFTDATESLQMWSQKMMVRLYAHMDISSSEQVMIEQLAEHGIQPSDMTQALMQNARVKNPLAEEKPNAKAADTSDKAAQTDGKAASSDNGGKSSESKSGGASVDDDADDEAVADPPPPYTAEEKAHVPEAVDPSTLEKKDNLDLDLRWTVLCDLFLVLISDSIYDSRSRVLLERVGEALDIPWLDICRFEKRVTDALEMQEQTASEDWDEAATIENRRKMALKKRYLMMGLATAGGGLIIGLSGGLLAPVIGAGLAAGFSAIGVAGTGTFLAGVGGAAIITTTSALAGGSIAIKASSRRMGAVRTFEYRPLHNNKRVNLILTISGWMTGKVDDVRLPFSTIDPIMGDIYSLFWEPDLLQSVGDTIRILATEALAQGLQQVLATTFLGALLGGLNAPLILTKLAYLIDNPWSSSLDRAERAGLILADSLIDRHLGVRPITLVGFSLGSRVIFAALKELSRRGAYGLVQNVYIFGSPVIANKEEWLRARTVISGRFVNGYASNDWILGYLFRATSGGLSRVAGLAPVENVPGVENFACTDIVNGHMAYRAAMPRLLRELDWQVLSDEFSEIEDPDPDNHEGRQRELIREIEDARQQQAAQAKTASDGKKSSGGGGGWWGRGKKRAAEKKGWETYEARKDTPPASPQVDGGGEEGRGAVLFDIDAIRRELESEHMEVRQLESTLPPMQLDLKAQAEAEKAEKEQAAAAAAKAAAEEKARKKGSGLNPFAALRGTKSHSNASSSTPASPASPRPAKPADVSSPPTSAKKAPPAAAAALYDYDEDEDADPTHRAGDGYEGGGVTMSFERPPSADPMHGAAWRDEQPARPSLKSANTAPATRAGLGLGIERNAWADEEETHGEEGEITMTFA